MLSGASHCCITPREGELLKASLQAVTLQHRRRNTTKPPNKLINPCRGTAGATMAARGRFVAGYLPLQRTGPCEPARVRD
ncbi:hypothetical protein NDU88_007161 [Pleurodeles waltl]|uniref:Uncharacterized protein n=1 Tax=Pleurodeles waltl TaxID=8319 RepID=A0AAV7MEF2_PLEWA|nr:hypothetical protein NDU88_007161 [Pleurodeles waltl]